MNINKKKKKEERIGLVILFSFILSALIVITIGVMLSN